MRPGASDATPLRRGVRSVVVQTFTIHAILSGTATYIIPNESERLLQFL